MFKFFSAQVRLIIADEETPDSIDASRGFFVVPALSLARRSYSIARTRSGETFHSQASTDTTATKCL